MYTLDPKSASAADTIGAYISETGKYTGVFTRAEKLKSATKQTDGIGFTFKDDSGRECRFDVWTRKGTGEDLSGMNQINAMMACLTQRKLVVSTANVKKWNNDTRTEEIMAAEVFADLMNKPIGLLLRSEEYEKMQDGHKTGESGWRMGLFAIFQADTELMASEIMARKTKPEQLGKVIGMLADKPLKKTGGAPQRQAASSGGSIADDDIPF